MRLISRIFIMLRIGGKILVINTKKMLIKEFGINEKLIDLSIETEEAIKDKFLNIDDIKAFNQYKVLRAMQLNRLSDIHFNWNTGYGYNDIGRETLERIYSDVFGTEEALVRPIIVSGTHALTLCLTGLLRPGDELISATSYPYDTLKEVIGIERGKGISLMDLGIIYKQIEFQKNGEVDLDKVLNSINNKTKMVYIQRSTGYGFRKALTIKNIEKIIKSIKNIKEDVICMVDNCYGEFLETKEPTNVGADIMAGSLIKNPGGGLALTGGYVVGNAELIELVSYRMTSPGIGKECGLTFGQTRSMFQGLFMAPQVVSDALKGAIFCAKIFESLGFEVCPNYNEERSDIIQSIKLGTEDRVIAFCEGIQGAAPVDSFVKPEPWDMPGYNDKVIMAAGAFVQGSSIELSADAPIRPPYIAYFQGGLTYNHSKFGVLKGIQSMLNKNLLSI